MLQDLMLVIESLNNKNHVNLKRSNQHVNLNEAAQKFWKLNTDAIEHRREADPIEHRRESDAIEHRRKADAIKTEEKLEPDADSWKSIQPSIENVTSS